MLSVWLRLELRKPGDDSLLPALAVPVDFGIVVHSRLRQLRGRQGLSNFALERCTAWQFKVVVFALQENKGPGDRRLSWPQES